MSGITLPSPPDAGTLEALARPEERVEGRDKVTGAARYAGDHAVPGMLHAAFLTSRVAHARVRSIDGSKARLMPGVQAVLTGEDVRGIYYGRRLLDRPLLAWDRVRFIGDRLAAVAAETPEQAEAATAEIDVDLEELPALFDVEAALEQGAPIVHDDAAGYRYLGGERLPVQHPNVQGRLTVRRDADEIEAILRSAPRVFEERFSTPSQHHAYIEPHATLVWIDDDGIVRVVSTNKAPFSLRDQFAAAFGLDPSVIDIRAGFIGGDFGGKGYGIDEFACYVLARATGRPVKAVMSFHADVATVNVRHASEIRLRTAVDADGRFLAHAADVVLDGGAYAAAKPLPHLSLAGSVATVVPYRVPHVAIVSTTVYTNTTPGGHMRAPGEVQALFAGESHIDSIARELGQDPLRFRLQNVVGPDDEGGTGVRFREARAREVLEVVKREMDWDRRRAPDHGLGVAVGARHVGGGTFPLRLRLWPDATVEILTALADQGGGAYSVMRRVLALTASIDPARIRVTHQGTVGSPRDPGVGGARVTHLVSRAADALGAQLREWLDERLPMAIPSSTSTTVLRDDQYVDELTGATIATFPEVVANLVHVLPVELSATYDGTVGHGPHDMADYNFAACAVEVAVDRETGAVFVEDALLVVDRGTIINPVAHRGQLVGGFAFGYGAARMEGLVVEDGVVLNPTLADMKIPTAADMPPLRIVELPTAVGPGAFGAKGAGEVTNAPIAPAIANAIADAVGVRIRALPITAERVLEALRAMPPREEQPT